MILARRRRCLDSGFEASKRILGLLSDSILRC